MAFYKMKVGCACMMLRMLLHHDCCIIVPGSICSGVSGVAVVCADLGRVIMSWWQDRQPPQVQVVQVLQGGPECVDAICCPNL
jgi:hypothetical protein